MAIRIYLHMGTVESSYMRFLKADMKAMDLNGSGKLKDNNKAQPVLITRKQPLSTTHL